MMKNVSKEKFQSEVENVQIYPARTRIELNDKATRTLFHFSAKDFQEIRTGALFNIVEVPDHPKHGKILTPCRLWSPYGEPLDEFDRAVLSVCTSEYICGNFYTTIPIIYRALIGRAGEGVNVRPTKNLEKAVRNSIDKMMATTVEFDYSKSLALLDYKLPKIAVGVLKSSLLPCCRAEVTINGQCAEIIFFDRLTPLFFSANAKNQIVRYDSTLLDVPKQRNTQTVISLKSYVMRRIAEIIAHRMSPTITFEDVFKKCRIDETDRKIHYKARQTIFSFFNHLKSTQHITNFDIKRKEVGKDYYGISFNYNIQK